MPPRDAITVCWMLFLHGRCGGSVREIAYRHDQSVEMLEVRTVEQCRTSFLGEYPAILRTMRNFQRREVKFMRTLKINYPIEYMPDEYVRKFKEQTYKVFNGTRFYNDERLLSVERQLDSQASDRGVK